MRFVAHGPLVSMFFYGSNQGSPGAGPFRTQTPSFERTW